MNCPACKSQMFVMEYDGLELDHCPACAGVWFDGGELALLFADAEDQAHPELVPGVLAGLPQAASAERKRRCPMCRRSMRKVNIGPRRRVLVDACVRGHGLFFDRGEVADLARDIQFAAQTLPARVIAFLGGTLDRGDAAHPTEES
ncbi:MAG: zf-TFIIB domain-containing protein [Candidatus Krumholzibacteria bacterium]|nr:zf-TFIIB domain-containing protein [Candidatus Krumholzibacteria bacterium]